MSTLNGFSAVRIELSKPGEVFYGPTHVVEIGYGYPGKIRVRIIEQKASDKEFAADIVMEVEPDSVERLGRVLIAEAKIGRRPK